MRIVVIGGGAAGIGAAWGLVRDGHQLTIIEAAATLGGHLMACDVPLPDGRSVSVDVGVSDFNRATFTNVGALFDELGLDYRPIGQQASFMHADGRTAWFSNEDGIHAVTPFADQARFSDEMARFRLDCVEVLDDGWPRDETLAGYCDRRGYSHEFRNLYLYPRAQGSFPMPDCDPATYPVRGLVGFWRIHGLAGPVPANRNVLTGGMASYPNVFAQWLEARGNHVLVNASVIGVARRSDGIRVRYTDAEGGSHEDVFDHAVFAVRGEQVLPMLEDASLEEREIFQSLRWHRARVVVHRDTALMPDRPEAWGAYNYVLGEGDVPTIRPTITFYPAKLAHLDDAKGIFVTMNPFREPAADLIIANHFLSHPAAGTGGELAAARIAQIQGIRNCWFCGSYLVQPWVHEPALATGVDLAETMRKRTTPAGDGQLPYLNDFLAAVPLFAGLDPFAIADLRLAADRFSLAAGDRLFGQGDNADGLYLVASGRVVLSARTPGDGLAELSVVGAGGVFGEFCLLDGGQRSAEARAAEPTLGYRIDIRRFGALRASQRPAAFELLERLRMEVARRTRATIDHMAAGDTLVAADMPAPAHTTGPAQDCGQLLRNFPGFSAFDDGHWRELAGLLDRIEVPRGTMLETAGAASGGLYIVGRGALRAAWPGADRLRPLLIYGPGALAGAAAMIDGGPWPTQLDAREDSIIYRLDARDFAALRHAHSPLAFRLFDMIGQQLTRDLRRLSRISSQRDSLRADDGEDAACAA